MYPIRLTNEQAQDFAEFAQAAVGVTSEVDFHNLVAQHVQRLLPHGMLIAVLGQLTFEHLTVQHHIAINYPDGAMAHVAQPINIRERPVLQRWLHTRAPVVVCPVADRSLQSDRELFENELLGLGRMAVHGLPDLTSRMGSYFSFAQVPADIDRKILELRLSIMIPLLHIALFQACCRSSVTAYKNALTTIESELLVWLSAGRSNQEMALLRQRSPATIRNQLGKLYAKLGVSTRAEAVSLAMSEVRHIPQPTPR